MTIHNTQILFKRKERSMNRLPLLCVSIALFLVSTAVICPAETLPTHLYESSLNAFTQVTYSPDGKGFLGINADGKKLLHVAGNPYEMGYQHGYLCAESVSHMASYDFWGGMIVYILGMDMTKEELYDLVRGDVMVERIVDRLFALIQRSIDDGDIPQEFIDEMQGIVDGANDAGYDDVTFKHVMMNNMAFDVILSMGYKILTPFLRLTDLEDRVGVHTPHSCNAFVAAGNATVDGRTLMGRDFMFPNGEYYKHGLLIEYVPDNGNRLVSVMTPSFVGTAAGMNDHGIGVGIDMVPARDNVVGELGMGGLMLNRYVLQYANELNEGISIYTSRELGVPWLFPIGDGLGDEQGGAIVELSPDRSAVRYMDYDQPSWGSRLGVPRQGEDLPDFVMCTNHYLAPIMYLAGSVAIEDSLLRYDILLGLALDTYGTLDTNNGRTLIDFLHPPNFDYYAPDPDQPVESSVSFYDLSNLKIWSLYGLYSDPWVSFEMDVPTMR